MNSNLKIIFETERILLREITPNDSVKFFELYTNKEIIKYTDSLLFKDFNDAKVFIENYDHYKKYGIGRWAIIVKDNNSFAGLCGLKFDEEFNEINLGFRLLKNYWGKGLATEAAKATLNYGFNVKKYNSIIARVVIENLQSIKILMKLGMRYEKDFIAHNSECKQFRIYRKDFLNQFN